VSSFWGAAAPLSKRASIVANRTARARAIEKAEQLFDVESRQELACGNRLVVAVPSRVHLNPVLLPEPDLRNTESMIDLELSDAAGGQDHFDDEIRPILAFLVGTEDIALVGLRGDLLGVILERRGRPPKPARRV